MRKEIKSALDKIFQGIDDLKNAFPHKEFTIDGRLVGDIGEIIAEIIYEIQLYEQLEKDYDAFTSDGKKIQIKATFKESLGFKKVSEYYLGLKLNKDGSFEEIYNGPGSYIFNLYQNRKGIGESLLSFPINKLKEISKTIPDNERIKERIYAE